MYCNLDDTKALINYRFGDGRTENRMVVGQLPIDITVDSIGKKLIVSSGSAPIAFIAPGNITSITCTGSFRQIGNRPETELPCTYVIENSTITGNQWNANYDSVYSDNTGDMSFTVNYLADECFIRIRNQQGKLIFKDSGQCPLTYEVKCIKDKCPEGYMKCESDAYPGYCCIPCNEIKAGIAAATTALRGMNRG